MKVILLQDVKGVGKKGQTVEVSDGYANNFILPRRLGVMATKRSQEILNLQIEDARKKDEENRLNAQEVAKQLETITLEFVAPSGKDGRMFGSISSKQIVDALKSKHNILIDKRKFLSNDTANVFGTTNFKVELYKGVVGTIKVHVSEKGK
ncbi:MAG: 50S ribosomal protein L9 [Bacilli bacterium]|nr:50S ribosomal protein L9 [Bacilli bacterium]